MPKYSPTQLKKQLTDLKTRTSFDAASVPEKLEMLMVKVEGQLPGDDPVERLIDALGLAIDADRANELKGDMARQLEQAQRKIKGLEAIVSAPPADPLQASLEHLAGIAGDLVEGLRLATAGKATATTKGKAK